MNTQEQSYHALVSLLDISYNSVYQALILKDYAEANKALEYLLKDIERVKQIINK